MTDFKFIKAYSLSELEKFVDNWVKQGWLPTGNLNIIPADGLRNTQYVWAMTYDKPKPYESTGPR